jgi:Mu transposase-like protein
VIGRRVEVIADLARVQVLCGGRKVADPEQIWALHHTITDLRVPRCCQGAAPPAGRGATPVSEPEVEQGCLADYETALGLDGGHRSRP